MRDNSRKVMSVTEVLGYQDEQIRLNPLCEFVESGSGRGTLAGVFLQTGKLRHREKLARAGYEKEYEELEEMSAEDD